MDTSPPAAARHRASGAGDPDRVNAVWLAASVLTVLFVAIVIVAVTTLTGPEPAASAGSENAQSRKLPAYWKVHTGDSYVAIARKTGLTVEQLETFNPYVNPATIRPGDRLALRANPPKPKTTGPIFHKVRKGDTFGSIAFRWKRTVPRLMQLNPKLKERSLQPGDRVRLRRDPS